MESSTGHLTPEVFLLNQTFFLVRGKGQNKCDTHGFCYSLVYVTRFIGKMCLLLRPLQTGRRLVVLRRVQPMVTSIPKMKTLGTM